MARNHARILVAIWNDPEFRELPANAQHAYFMLVSQPRLSYCGVLDYFPSRLAKLSKGSTAAKVESAVKTLQRGRFVIVDRDTDELLVRTFIKHDGIMERVNMGKAMGRAYLNVVSPDITQAILDELAKLYLDEKAQLGWNGFSDECPDAYDDVALMASRMPLRMASGMG